MTSPLPTLIHAIGAGAKRARDLTRAEAYQLARAVVFGEAEPVQIGAILLSFRIKGETADEIAGFTQAVAEAVPRIPAAALTPLGTAAGAPPGVDVDLHGDGHQGRPSTALAAACIAVGAGARVLLRCHLGSRHSHVGLGRVAESMGVLPAATAAHAAETIAAGAPALLDTQTYHPRLGSLLDLRDLLGVRTIVQTSAKLVDPAGFGAHLVGIFHAPFHDPVAGALDLLGSRRALIVRAPGGLPEPSPDKQTPYGSQLRGQAPRLEDVPALALVEEADLGALPATTTPDDAALLALDALERGVRGPMRHALLVGAATMLLAAGVETEWEAAFARAKISHARGAATRALERWRTACARHK